MNAAIYNILIIENNLSFSLELEIILKDIGHQVIASVNNPKDALSFIHSQKIDIILIGIHIKGNLSSIEFSQQIKHLNIPIIFMTSTIDNKNILSELSNNVGFFIKPIHPFTLESTIDFVLSSSRNIFQKKYNLSPPLFHDFIFAKNGNKSYRKILIQDIQCLEAAGDFDVRICFRSLFYCSSKRKRTNRQKNCKDELISPTTKSNRNGIRYIDECRFCPHAKLFTNTFCLYEYDFVFFHKK